jgi:hypothetical protein
MRLIASSAGTAYRQAAARILSSFRKPRSRQDTHFVFQKTESSALVVLSGLFIVCVMVTLYLGQKMVNTETCPLTESPTGAPNFCLVSHRALLPSSDCSRCVCAEQGQVPRIRKAAFPGPWRNPRCSLQCPRTRHESQLFSPRTKLGGNRKTSDSCGHISRPYRK